LERENRNRHSPSESQTAPPRLEFSFDNLQFFRRADCARGWCVAVREQPFEKSILKIKIGNHWIASEAESAAPAMTWRREPRRRAPNFSGKQPIFVQQHRIAARKPQSFQNEFEWLQPASIRQRCWKRLSRRSPWPKEGARLKAAR